MASSAPPIFQKRHFATIDSAGDCATHFTFLYRIIERDGLGNIDLLVRFPNGLRCPIGRLQQVPSPIGHSLPCSCRPLIGITHSGHLLEFLSPFLFDLAAILSPARALGAQKTK